MYHGLSTLVKPLYQIIHALTAANMARQQQEIEFAFKRAHIPENILQAEEVHNSQIAITHRRLRNASQGSDSSIQGCRTVL